jgi:hypothetical protein
MGNVGESNVDNISASGYCVAGIRGPGEQYGGRATTAAFVRHVFEMLVSCHIPKTAGTSFAAALSEVFGDRFFWDLSHGSIIPAMCADNRFPVETVPIRWLSRYKRSSLRGVGCVHGHFPLRKYVSLAFDRKNIFVVWLREPLQWRISLYYFLKQNYPHPTDGYINRIFDQNWDLERFCADPTYDNHQSLFLAWFPWWRINFVGVTENYASDLAYLSRHILHREMPFYKKNETKKPDGLLDGSLGGRFLQRFESNNRVDYRHYRKALLASNARALIEAQCGHNDAGARMLREPALLSG